VALWIATGASPNEVSVRAGHTSVAFTLDRYGHLCPSHDRSCATAWTPCTRPVWSARPAAGQWWRCARPRRGHGEASNEEDPPW